MNTHKAQRKSLWRVEFNTSPREGIRYQDILPFWSKYGVQIKAYFARKKPPTRRDGEGEEEGAEEGVGEGAGAEAGAVEGAVKNYNR